MVYSCHEFTCVTRHQTRSCDLWLTDIRQLTVEEEEHINQVLTESCLHTARYVVHNLVFDSLWSVHAIEMLICIGFVFQISAAFRLGEVQFCFFCTAHFPLYLTPMMSRKTIFARRLSYEHTILESVLTIIASVRCENCPVSASTSFFIFRNKILGH